MHEHEISPQIERLIGRLKVRGWHRPNWGWGSREPVPMFTEVEIRAACAMAKLSDQETDDMIEALKDARAHHIVEITP
jgi:hypothetical protein